MFAIKAKCPILPVMMRKKAKLFSGVDIIIGNPITFDDYYDKKIGSKEIEELDEVIKTAMLSEQDALIEMKNNKRRKKK